MIATAPALPGALLAVFGVILFFALCGLVASSFAAFRRWRARRALERLAAKHRRRP